MPPQDIKFKDEITYVEIGKDCIIRENVTIHSGTKQSKSITKVGNNCFLMVDSHVAHDCMIGDNVILINQATLAGHTSVGDYAIIGGLSALHQHVRIGKHAFIAGMTGVEQDILPYGLAKGILRRCYLTGVNITGLKIPSIKFWSLWENNELMGCGALKFLDKEHGEFKSIRVHDNFRNKGYGAKVVNHLIKEAIKLNIKKLSIETGAGKFFNPARKLFTKCNFRHCKPFAHYKEDINSIYLTKLINNE